MIFRRVLLAAMAFSALTACLAGLLVASILAAFWALQPALGPAGAAGALALVLAVSLALAALIVGQGVLTKAAKPSRGRAPGGPGLEALAEARPILSMVLATGAGLAAAANPKLLSAAARFILKAGAGNRSA